MYAVHDSNNDQYADSLLALGKATGSLAILERDLVLVLDLLTGNGDVLRFMGDPAVTQEGKSETVGEILGGKVHPVLVHFTQILLEAGRLGDLKIIAENFFDKASRLARKVAGELVSASPVKDEVLALIEGEISRILGKEVHLRVRVDRNMLGGLMVRVGDFVIDGSVEAVLEDMRRVMLGGKVTDGLRA